MLMYGTDVVSPSAEPEVAPWLGDAIFVVSPDATEISSQKRSETPNLAIPSAPTAREWD